MLFHYAFVLHIATLNTFVSLGKLEIYFSPALIVVPVTPTVDSLSLSDLILKYILSIPCKRRAHSE